MYDTDFEGLLGLKPPEKVEKKIVQPKETKPKVVSTIDLPLILMQDLLRRAIFIAYSL